MSISPEILEIIACPINKTPLIYDTENAELISLSANVAYPIEDGIPALLPDKGRMLSEAEQTKWRTKQKKQKVSPKH